MYPKEQKNPTAEELVNAIRKNPEAAAAARGLWGDLEFLEKVAELNPKLKETQFADYHGHGWVFVRCSRRIAATCSISRTTKSSTTTR